jgi:hypothetical protein
VALRVGELRAVWVLVSAVAVAVFVTYARLPPDDLYNVSSSGVRGGLSRLVVELNFPDALIALAVLGVIAPALPRALRPLVATAVLLCLVVVVPGVVSQKNLDAKWINAAPALGVGLALALSFFARRLPRSRRVRGDRVRVALAAVLVLLAAPWIAAELGFYLVGVPVLGRIFQTSKIVSYNGNALHPAVHHGVHHGLQGLLLIVTALLLSRLPNRVSLFLALMVAYGLGNIANDMWLEQIAERGWTSWTIPPSLEPGLTWTWLAVLLATPAIWLLWFRQHGRPTAAGVPATLSYR